VLRRGANSDAGGTRGSRRGRQFDRAVAAARRVTVQVCDDPLRRRKLALDFRGERDARAFSHGEILHDTLIPARAKLQPSNRPLAPVKGVLPVRAETVLPAPFGRFFFFFFLRSEYRIEPATFQGEIPPSRAARVRARFSDVERALERG